MIRLAVRCRAEHAELALAQLIELAPTGIEEVRDGDIVEYAIYGPPGEVPTLPDLQVAVGDDLVEVRTTEVPDDWHERWKQFHGAVLITGERGEIDLRPSWEDGEARAEATAIVLDPGQAFGTGSHPTTRLCLQLLLDLEPGGEVVDLGCGSGVLAIAAAKLGWSPVRGYDHDHLAVDATVVNARDNDVELVVDQFDLRGELPDLAPTVLANLMRPLLLKVAGLVPNHHGVKSVILSGLLDDEADEISAVYAALGLCESRRVSEGGWTGLLLRAA
ncbi:MAG: 50S ribosomal protein L11 methyltransferase [Solirubrobacterales bacterium]